MIQVMNTIHTIQSFTSDGRRIPSLHHEFGPQVCDAA